MKFSKSIVAILISLIIIIYIIISFYLYQKNMQKKHTIFVATINKLIHDNLRVNYDILSTSIFAYNNEDIIAKNTKALKQQYNKLKNLDSLKRKHCQTLKISINNLGELIDNKITNITYFLILNANIKNSFIFLLNYRHKSHDYFKQSNNINKQINSILNNFSYIRKTQDINHLDIIKLLLSSKKLDKKQLAYISLFNLHAKYIKNHINIFFQTLDLVTNNKLHKYIIKINNQFNALTKRDDMRLNRQTFFVIIIIIIGALFIIFLTLRLNKENDKLKKAERKLVYQASHDSLTKILNRVSFENILKTDKDFLLLLIDINGFKHINDFYGTDIGNLVLQEFALFIQIKTLEQYDALYYRTGGDIFAILLSNVTIQNAFKIAQDLSNIISSHNFCINNLDISISVKIAINNIRPLMENADMGLKRIKSQNKENIIIFNEKLELKKEIKANLDIVNLVKHAIQNKKVIAYFQPILNIKSQKIEKYEALVRIIKEDGSILPPMAFLPTIENTQLYYKITEIMITKILKIAKINKQYRFSLNLSMRDITNEKLMTMLFYKLEQHKLDNANIDIELLETQELYDISKVKDFIIRAHELDCRILIDDFGTGYSNFAYLSELDVDVLKIDASIIKNILTNNKMMKTLISIKQFATALNIQTVAEFVDNQKVLDEIQKIGIDYAQGYLIGKPTPPPPNYLMGYL